MRDIIHVFGCAPVYGISTVDGVWLMVQNCSSAGFDIQLDLVLRLFYLEGLGIICFMPRRIIPSGTRSFRRWELIVATLLLLRRHSGYIISP